MRNQGEGLGRIRRTGMIGPALATAIAVISGAPHDAAAETYPTRPVRVIVGFAPGGTTDIIARLIGQRLSERFGQQFVIENRPGAGSNLAVEAVVNAPADGHTLLLITATNAINPALYEKLNFNFIGDIAPVIGIFQPPNVMEVNPSLPVKSVPEFIAYAKANPGKINMASGGIGTPAHVSGEFFRMMTAAPMVHVPYRGTGPALVDLIGGQVQVMFDALPASIEHIRARKLRPLAVTTAMRSELLPDVPTIGEFVPGYEASGWFGIGVRKTTSVAIIDQLNKEIGLILADPGLNAQLRALGGVVIGGSPADFAKLIADDTEKWARVVKFSGARVQRAD
jgi:tripartite-type tricarboxylate transporter receptor subunit TctC